MLDKCENCSGNIKFVPSKQANVCENCGKEYLVNYTQAKGKRPVKDYVVQQSNTLKSIRCESCGANIVLNKYQIQTICPYCGSSSLKEGAADALNSVDVIIPFAFDRYQAYDKFTHKIRSNFFANKKVLENLGEEDVKEVYINSFIFDISIDAVYSVSYRTEKTITDEQGNKHKEQQIEHRTGNISRSYKDITIEANSNLTQRQLLSVMPYNFKHAVKFREEFVSSYIVETADVKLSDCVEKAERVAQRRLKAELLNQFGCTDFITCDIEARYPIENYSHALLPMYFITTTHKNKTNITVMNGDSGKMGKYLKDKLKIWLTTILCAFGISIIALVCAMVF